MRRSLALLIAAAGLVLAPGALAAPAGLAAAEIGALAEEQPGNDRLVPPQAGSLGRSAVTRFGPFEVRDPTHAALVGPTDGATPRQFAAMLAAFPGMAVLEMVECPGTTDDTANLRLGRMIRRAGLATHVPADGSVRSGAVELFLAGARRSAENGAEFAVHAWEDTRGREPKDYAETDPVNLAYLAYYREMGLSAVQARAFYAMTNATPHDSARWLDARELAEYAALDPAGG